VSAIDRRGHVTVLTHNAPRVEGGRVGNSGLARGRDIGTQSEGFVPARYANALVSDRGTPHNRHPATTRFWRWRNDLSTQTASRPVISWSSTKAAPGRSRSRAAPPATSVTSRPVRRRRTSKGTSYSAARHDAALTRS
jgi:hypothetical protein